MLEQLACNLGRNDEEPNIDFAIELCEKPDHKIILELVEGLSSRNKAIANDCIKVLYEIGERKPELISDYNCIFISHLLSENNRIAWGSMTALATISHLQPDAIFSKIDDIKKAYETGSVITRDNSITVFAKLCKADKKYEQELFSLLIHHLSSCRPKEVPQHAERISICVNSENAALFLNTLKERKPHLTSAQMTRIHKLMKKIQNY